MSAIQTLNSVINEMKSFIETYYKVIQHGQSNSVWSKTDPLLLVSDPIGDGDLDKFHWFKPAAVLRN